MHSAEDWEELLLPEIERQQKLGKEVVFRADAAFARVLSSSVGAWQTWPMKRDTLSYHGYRFPPDIISHAVWLYHRFGVSFRDVEDLLAQRGITVSYEAIRLWCLTFGSVYARRLKRRQGRLGDIWHLDEVFVTIQGTAALSLACRRSRW